jgi:uncharacterized phage protein gp47/JayE
MSNVPVPTFGPNGFIAPTESDILNGRLADYNISFGGNLNLDIATPQGQLATSDAAIIGATNDLFLYYTNQVDPAFASGRFQDAIARIYYLTRKGPLPTTVDCACVGAAGTIIPAGSLARGLDGTIYQSLGQVTIPIAGTVTQSFAAIVDGPIAAPANSVNSIYRVVPGWDSVNNPADGVPGRNNETRAAMEDRRAGSVSGAALGILPAIRAAVLNAPDVNDAYVTENDTAAPVTIKGVTIPANAIYVAVVGGTDADVARAIWTKKGAGAPYYGSTSVTVEDTSSGYSIPYPAYTVKFTRAAALPIFITVTIASNADIPSDAATQIKAAVVSAFSGGDGGSAVKIGATVFALRYAAPIIALGSWAANIISIKVGITSPGAVDDVVVDINKIPTIDAANITVTVV